MKLYLVLILLFPLTCQGQLFTPPEDLGFELAGFNLNFVAQNSIRSIALSKSLKREGQSMKKQLDKKVYTFDREGVPVLQLSIVQLFGQPDTTALVQKHNTSIEYSSRGCRKEVLTTPCANGWRIATYACACEFDGENILVLDSSWISHESIAVDEHELWTLEKTFSYNNQPAYLKVTERYDTLGYLQHRTREYLTTRQKEKIEFIYNLHGDVASVLKSSDLSKLSSRTTFEYDSFHGLNRFENWENNEQVSWGEIVYGDTALPEGAVEQKASGEIIMYKFTYEFYD